MTLLSVEHISYGAETGFIRKRKKEILHDISFCVEKGETVGITGASGAGKSTLSRVVMGLLREDGGDIVFQGKLLTKISAREAGCRRRQMHMLFQNPASSLNPRMRIRESMEEPAKIHGMDISRGQEIHDMMKRLQLREELLHRYPHQLSGGELQRVCLGRLLLLKPGLLILDEPTAGVDIELRRSMWEFLTEINNQGTSIILTTHYLEEAELLCRRIAIIDKGVIKEDTDIKSLLSTLSVETFVLDLKQPLTHWPALNREGIYFRPVDAQTVEVSIDKGLALNDVFSLLGSHQIEVSSMRNKSNRLEELFIHMVEKNLTEKNVGDQQPAGAKV